jgi:protein-disulfide isomerase
LIKKLKDMKKQAIIISSIVIAVLGLGFLLFQMEPSASPGNTKIADAGKLIREDSYRWGNKDSKVTLVEFLDFQCEACRAAHPVTKRLRAEYGDKINFVQRYFPLPSHKNSKVAALAAAAAGEQGKYWEMEDKLFENQDAWGSDERSVSQNKAVEMFKGYASELGLDVERFSQSIKSEQFMPIIQRDVADGDALRVNSTPTFFFNGEMLPGVQRYEILKEKIDKILQEKTQS